MEADGWDTVLREAELLLQMSYQWGCCNKPAPPPPDLSVASDTINHDIFLGWPQSLEVEGSVSQWFLFLSVWFQLMSIPLESLSPFLSIIYLKEISGGHFPYHGLWCHQFTTYGQVGDPVALDGVTISWMEMVHNFGNLIDSSSRSMCRRQEWVEEPSYRFFLCTSCTFS